MSRLLLTSLLALSAFPAFAAGPKVTRIDPTDWYVGMRNPKLQLMVYGPNISSADVTTAYPGVTVDSIVRLSSPNYLLVYLDTRGAAAGEMTLRFRQGKRHTDVAYRLKARAMRGDQRHGFTAADVLYMLMPDRFAQGTPQPLQPAGLRPYKVDRQQPSLRHGGNLEGIRRHLDYFTDLGVTALWFTPVLENDSPDEANQSTYHGYATTDYYRVDPRFGSNDDYARLVREAHAKGLKVVMDMIFNHCGFHHPWVADLPSRDWLNTPDWLTTGRQGAGEPKPNADYLQTSYKLTPVLDPYASQADLRETVDGWFVPSMPDLNQRNTHVMRYLIQNSIWWVETAGIDGIRMDTYPYADRLAMAQWMKELDEEYPDFNTVGETWVTEPAYTAAWQKDSKLSDTNSYLKTVMDFSFYEKINKARDEQTDAWWGGFNRIYNSLCYDYLYADPSHVMAFIENHDTDRYLGDGSDALRLRQALALLLTIRRIPQLYYGTEVLMNGTKQATDGNVRRDFPGGFPGDRASAFTAEGRTEAQNAMYMWLRRLLHWRQTSKAVTEGAQIQFCPVDGVYVVARRHRAQTVMTIVNGLDTPATLRVSRYAEIICGADAATDICTGRRVPLSADIPLQPRATLVLDFQTAL